MSHVLLVAGALIFEPDWDQVEPHFVPDRLAQRLTRARRVRQALTAPWSDGAAQLEWLARAFSVPGDPPSCAAYSWRAAQGQRDSDTVPGDAWFCEPVHFSLEPDRTVLSPIDAPPLTDSESRELFLEAGDTAREHGAALCEAAGRWYLFPDEPWGLRTTPLPAVLGASIETRMPHGTHASRWRRLLNEIQMRWHAHRVNQERESRRQQVANGLWLHGGGPWSTLGASRFDQVDTDDSVLLGWRQAAASQRRAQRDSLTTWSHLFDPYWRRDWRAWAARWAQLDREVDALLNGTDSHGGLELVACGRQSAVTFMFGRGLLPWRRPALRESLLESITR